MNGFVLESALQALVGLKLTDASHAGNTRTFGFAQGTPRSTDISQEYRLHLQCPWRLVRGDELITGSLDWYEPEDADSGKIYGEDWDAAKGGSHQEAVLRFVFNDGQTERRYLVNATDVLLATSFAADRLGGFHLHLSPDYTLSAFPAASRSEHWRLFQTSAGRHLVVQGGSARWE
jgi:hypothetical protein